MALTPIVERFRAHPTAEAQQRVEQLAEHLLLEYPDLVVDDWFRPLIVKRLVEAPTLHLDDLSEIFLRQVDHSDSVLEDRARLRACDGDLVASCSPRVRGYEQYCRERLRLGSITWLRPGPGSDPLHVAAACWRDREIRRVLVQAARGSKLLYVHPYMGNLPVWAVSYLLRKSSRRPIKVIAPTPSLTLRVNDKLWFARTVSRLFGQQVIPRTEQASNLAILAGLVQELAAEYRSIVLKIPSSAGGDGNLVVGAERFRGQPLGSIREELRDLLSGLDWQGGSAILVGRWASEVLSTPSVQTWIPPEAEGLPIVESLCEQLTERREGLFIGHRPASYPSAVSQVLVDSCWLLARLFQRLGYIGRCSFDTLLLGRDLDSCRLKFVECNGRWGGSSLPMTLMNRLFDDRKIQPYVARRFSLPGLEMLRFDELLERFSAELFDARTGRGKLIFYNPGRLTVGGGVEVIALSKTSGGQPVGPIKRFVVSAIDEGQEALERCSSQRA